jgi:hypothetical protein
MSATITNATRILAGGDLAELSTMLVADLAEHGVLGDSLAVGERFVAPGDYQIGDLVAIYAHQRYRIARVWKVGRTRVSAVYVTPSEVDAAGKVGRRPYPNNITAEPASLVARDGQPGSHVGISLGADVAPVAGGVTVPAATPPAFHVGMLPIGAELEGALF